MMPPREKEGEPLTIAAVPTPYRGCLFRSRLEARWAVFFDTLKVPWLYEPQRYYVGMSGRTYLPDFYLPDSRTWVEVKGSVDSIDWQLLADAVDWGCGLPYTKNSFGTSRGLLLLGPVPPVAIHSPVHVILQHDKGGWVNGAWFLYEQIISEPDDSKDLQFDSSWGDGLGEDAQAWIKRMLTREYIYPDQVLTDYVAKAYRAARSARFEHGQYGGML
jgi:hypothetical protein